MARHPAQNQPIETLRDGRLKATLWENQSENGTYHTVSLAKVYEDKEGALQETNSFSAGELLRVAELARESHGLIRDLHRDQSHERQVEQTRMQADRPSRSRKNQADRFKEHERSSLDR